jgi:hypothetical protein
MNDGKSEKSVELQNSNSYDCAQRHEEDAEKLLVDFHFFAVLLAISFILPKPRRNFWTNFLVS